MVDKNPRHRLGRGLWLGIYVLVAIQLAWMLRPFIGAPGLETRFLRAESWDNAYVVVMRTVVMALE